MECILRPPAVGTTIAVLVLILCAQSAAAWQWLNPKPTPQNLESIIFLDSNTGYVVGNIGTILKTTDGGASWAVLNSGTDEYLMSAAFPVDATTGYAAGSGGTILKTQDEGVTWTSQTSGTTWGLNVIQFPFDEDTGYAAGENGTILKTANGGSSWTPRTSGTTYTLYDMQFPEDATTGYIVGDAGTVLKTTDGGASWSPLTSGTTEALFGVHFPENATTGFAVGDNGTILKTTDGGASWTPKASGVTLALYKVFFPLNSTTGYISCDDGTMLKTTDGGDNWTVQVSGSAQPLGGIFFFPDEVKGFVVGFGGEILKTLDGGENWSSLFSSFFTATVRTVNFPVDNVVGYAAGDNGSILKTTDGGASWTPQTSGTANTLTMIDFPVDASTGYIVGNSGIILKTVNGGATWTPQTSGTTSNLFGIHFPVDSKTGYATGLNGRILKTTNGGTTWTYQTSGTTATLFSVNFPVNSTTGYIVGTNGMILKTLNGGTSWSPQTSNSTAHLSGVHFPLDTSTGYAVGPSEILKTINGGVTWLDIFPSTTDSYSKVIFPAGADTGYVVGTSGIIRKTTDGGGNWIKQHSGTTAWLSSVDFPVGSNTGFIAGGGGTLLKDVEGGAWSPHSDTSNPAIADNQSGDDVPRSTNTTVFDVDFSDAGGSHLNQFQVRACASNSNCGDVKDWTIAGRRLAVDSYTTNWSLPVDLWSALPEGTSYISVRVFDGAGNMDEQGPLFYVIVDLTRPLQSGWAPATGTTQTSSTITVTFNTNENADCRWSLSDLAYASMAGDCAGDGTMDQSCPVTGLVDGANSVYTACRDTAGNADTAATNVRLDYIVDLTPPSQSNWNPPKGASFATTTVTLTFTTNETADCRWSLDDEDYGTMTGDCTGDGTTGQSCDLSGLAEGAFVLYTGCRDSFGHEDTAATNEHINYAVDFTPPACAGWNPASSSTVYLYTQPVTFTADENAWCKWSLSDDAFSSMPGDCEGDGTTSLTCTVSGLVEGSNIVYIACEDYAGNENTGNYELSYTVPHMEWVQQTSGVTQHLYSINFPLDSKTGYAVGSSGRILKTTDGGATWTPKTSGTANNLLSVCFPVDETTGYAVGYNGTILKTTNGGDSWTPQTSGTTNILRSVIFPSDAAIGYVVGNNGVVLKTTNGGGSWSNIVTIPTYDFYTAEFPADPVYGYVAGEGGKIFKTTSGGSAWSEKTSGTNVVLSDLAFPVDSQTGYAVGGHMTNATIVKTSDYGFTFSPQTSIATKMLLSIHFPSDNLTGFAVGYDGMVITTSDGGANWTYQRSGVGTYLYSVHFPGDGKAGYAVGSYGTIIKHGAGLTESVAPAITGNQAGDDTVRTQNDGVYDIDFSDSGGSGLAQFQVRACSTNANCGDVAGWTIVGRHLATDSYTGDWKVPDSLWDFLANGTNYISVRVFDGAGNVAEQGPLFYIVKDLAPPEQSAWSPDKGATLTTMPVALSFTTGENAWCRWSMLDQSYSAMDEDCQGGGTTSHSCEIPYLPEGSATVYTSCMDEYDNKDTALTNEHLNYTVSLPDWIPLESGTSHLLTYAWFPVDDRTGYVAGGNDSDTLGIILKTSDYGETWSIIKNNYPHTFSAICFPEDELTGYVTGGGGTILKTTDGGLTWEEQDSGTTVDLYAMTFPENALEGYAGGEGGVVLKTTDGGETWTGMTSTGFSVYSLVFPGGGDSGFAAGGSVETGLGYQARTNSGGLNWTRQINGTVTFLWSMTFPLNLNTGYVAGGFPYMGQEMQKTINGGMEWTEVTTGNTDVMGSISFPAGNTTGYAGGENGTILKTTDGGESWTRLNTGTSVFIDNVNFPAGERIGFAVGVNGLLMKTVTGGGMPPADQTPPEITDSQSGDDTLRNSNSAVYAVTFSDSGDSLLLQFQARACSTNSNCGDVRNWTIVKKAIASDSYVSSWKLPDSLWSALPDGTSYISVRAFDGAGNVAEQGPLFYIRKDTTPPEQDGWSPATGSVLANSSAQVTFSLNEVGNCRWSLSDLDYSAMESDCTGTGIDKQCDVSGLEEATETIYISCSDAQGNMDTADTNDGITYFVDISPPAQSNWDPPDGDRFPAASTTVIFSTSEAADCRYALSDLAYAAMEGDCAGDGSTSQTCAVSGLEEGSNSVFISCRDANGNEDTDLTNTALVYNVDFSPPVPGGWDPPGGSSVGTSTPLIAFTTDEAAWCRWSLTDQAYGEMTDGCGGGGTATQECQVSGLPTGSASVFIACADVFDREDTADTNEDLDYLVDLSPPVQSNWKPAKGSYIPGVSQVVTFKTNKGSICGWSLTDAGCGDIPPANTCSGAGTMSQSCPVSGLPEGAARVYFACGDIYGNEDTAETNEEVDYFVDTSVPEPVAAVYDGAGMDIDSATTTATLAANWTEAADPQSGIAGYWYSAGTSPGGGDTIPWTDAGTSTSFLASGLALAAGQSYYVSVKAENGAGLLSGVSTSDGITILSLGEVTEMKAVAGDHLVLLTWKNPAGENFGGVAIVRDTESYPETSEDGDLVFIGTDETYEDTEVWNDTIYYYTAFAYEKSGKYTTAREQGAHAAALPRVVKMNIKTGWNQVGVSRLGATLAPAEDLKDAEYEIIQVASGSAFIYLTDLQQQDLALSGGYWIYSSKDIGDVDVGGAKYETSPHDVSLGDGWNMFSSPFLEPLLWHGVNASLSCGGVPAALPDVYHMEEPLSYSCIPPAANSIIEPWKGYWIYVDGPCTLTLGK